MAALYGIFFCLISAFVIISLFIGAVVGGMSEALEDFERDAVRERAALEAKAILKADPNGVLIRMLRDYFDSIDDNGSGEIDAAELQLSLNNYGKVSALVFLFLVFFLFTFRPFGPPFKSFLSLSF